MRIQTKLLLMAALSILCLVTTGIFVVRGTNQVEAFQKKSEIYQNQLITLTAFRAQVRNLLFQTIYQMSQKDLKPDQLKTQIAAIGNRINDLARIADPSRISNDKELDQYDVEILRNRFFEIRSVIESALNKEKPDFKHELQTVFESQFLPAMDTIIQEIGLGSKYESIQLEGKV